MRKRELLVIQKRVERHLHIVPPIAERCARNLPPAFELEDLIQTGNMGLVKAAHRYAPRSHGNTPFEPFARPIVAGAILDSVRRRNYTHATMLRFEPRFSGTVTPTPEICIDQAHATSRVRGAVLQLKPQQQAVIAVHYGRDETLKTTAKVFDISKSKAVQIHQAALKELHGILKVA